MNDTGNGKLQKLHSQKMFYVTESYKPLFTGNVRIKGSHDIICLHFHDILRIH